ncbi:hypothetical protein [Leifsonia poae]|uniref:Uncharacterized protein n=1 Tax=Leifsonia poae TaxID=110933 RepID=A0A9W6LY51_9MICO|nr:hypothetical protein [Leifsonia poae]GLJ74475.1 hypothetical protein GCM10017584_00480 [Leifsonia poae]
MTSGEMPIDVLSELLGDRMYSVEFVVNDYVQFRFDGQTGTNHPVVLNSYVWPSIEALGRTWHETDLGYADAIRQLAPGVVQSAVEATGTGIRIELDTGVIVIHPLLEEVFVEIAELMGLRSGAWVVWRPGEESFEDLV